jgi:transcriptional regulator with XRE-family HTH domain
MADRGLTQAALARLTGVDRSTLSQLLLDGSKRLPNAQFLAESAAALGLSTDWLLGLTDRAEPGAQMMAPVDMADAPRALIDAAVLGWYRAADGQKIRHVPAGLPDILKTADMLAWEAAPNLGPDATRAVLDARARQEEIRAGRSDHEMAMSLQEMDNFLHGVGLYRSCPRALRAAQTQAMIAALQSGFPRLRLTLFDARRIYSVPLTVFGTGQAAVYLGQSYLMFRDLARVEALAGHFDGLVRQAAVDDRAIIGHLPQQAALAGL